MRMGQACPDSLATDMGEDFLRVLNDGRTGSCRAGEIDVGLIISDQSSRIMTQVLAPVKRPPGGVIHSSSL